jgi:recombinational DNA repair protein (RecF pathway)
LLEQCTETDTPVPELFELLAGYIVAVEKQDTPLTVFAFELKLLDALGMAPDSASLKLTAGVKRLLQHLTAAEWNGLAALRLSEAQFLELRQFLHGFLSFHVGKIPLSRTKAVNAEVLPCKTDRRP